MAKLNRDVNHNKQQFTKGMNFSKNHAYYDHFNKKGWFTKQEVEVPEMDAPAATNGAKKKKPAATKKLSPAQKKAADAVANANKTNDNKEGDPKQNIVG